MSEEDSKSSRPSRPSHSSPPSSGPPPAEFVSWGPVRDAVTSIHNLETLLRSPRVGASVLEPVLPEVLSGVKALRAAFRSAADSTTCAARDALSSFAVARLDEIQIAVELAASAGIDARSRLGLEKSVARVSAEVGAATELLDLVERADHAATTDLSLRELGRTLSAKSRAIEPEIVTRLDVEDTDHAVVADPHVLKRLVAYAVSHAHAHGANEVTIRVVPDGARVVMSIAKSEPTDEALPQIPVRLVRRVGPTDAVVLAAAKAAKVGMQVTGGLTRLSVTAVV